MQVVNICANMPCPFFTGWTSMAAHLHIICISKSGLALSDASSVHLELMCLPWKVLLTTILINKNMSYIKVPAVASLSACSDVRESVHHHNIYVKFTRSVCYQAVTSFVNDELLLFLKTFFRKFDMVFILLQKGKFFHWTLASATHNNTEIRFLWTDQASSRI